jgi:hypothetical protein
MSEKAMEQISEQEEATTAPFSERRNPRIYIQKQLAKRLVKLGISDDASSVGDTVNELANYMLTLGDAYLVDASDALVIQKSLADRADELTLLCLELHKALTDLEAAAEYKTLIHTFKNNLSTAKSSHVK